MHRPDSSVIQQSCEWSDAATHLAIQSFPIDVSAGIDFVRSDGSGGIDVFLGTVRNVNDGRAVRALNYEAYPEMCIELLRAICAAARERHELHRIYAAHRTGRLDLQEAAVIVAVSSRHRSECFSACREIIDAIKHELPIWKKEEYTDGDSAWVRCSH